MADAKVTELTAATSAAASDLLYIVDGTSSKKITISNLFKTVATPTAFTDVVAVQDSETVSGTYATSINTTTNVTYLEDWTQGGNVTLLAGAQDGQIKMVVMTTNSNNVSIAITGTRHPQTVTFSNPGDAASFIYNSTTGHWYFIGGSAAVS